MKTVFIVLDPSAENSDADKNINKIHQLREFLELRLWILPKIKKLNKKFTVNVISSENDLIKNLAKIKDISIIKERIPEQNENHTYEQAIKLFEEWRQYGELPELLQILDINIPEVFQEELTRLFFELLKQIDLANATIKHECPDIVYVQSNLFPIGQAYNVVAANEKLEFNFVEPMFYRKFKDWFRSYFRKKLYILNTSKHFNIYSIPKKLNNISQYKVLMDTPSINYFNALFPVIQEISNRSNSECYIRGRESDFSGKINNIQRVDVENVNITAYRNKIMDIKQYYHYKLKIDINFKNIFVHKDINFWDAIERDISYWFDQKVTEAILDIVSFNKVIEEINPHILIVGTDSAVAMRGHVLLAKQRGIPVLNVQHGSWSHNWRLATPLSDRIAAGGDYSKKIYTMFGTKEEQILVTGWPMYDKYVKLKDYSTEKHNNEVCILFATQPIDFKLNLNTIEAIGSFIEDSRHVHLIVKPHPAENSKIYYTKQSKYKNIIVKKSGDNISKLIDSSDILITVSSTVAIEAAILDKPIICINTTNEESIYVSTGIAIGVRKLDDLVPAIKDILYNEDVCKKLSNARKKFIYEQAYILDGQASKRVADLIQEMIPLLKGQEV